MLLRKYWKEVNNCVHRSYKNQYILIQPKIVLMFLLFYCLNNRPNVFKHFFTNWIFSLDCENEFLLESRCLLNLAKRVKVSEKHVPDNHILQYMEFLDAAINGRFHNGLGKELATQLIIWFMLPQNNGLIGNVSLISINQDCASDGFLLEREYLSRPNNESCMAINGNPWGTSHNSTSHNDAPSLRSVLSTTKHHRTADVVSRLRHRNLFAKENNIPRRGIYVIVECKSSSDGQSLRDAMAQCLSYGLAYRHRNKYQYTIKLLIITPFVWAILTLPPYVWRIGLYIYI